MRHLLLLQYVFSFSSGLVALAVTFLLYLRERKRVIVLFCLFHTSLQLLMVPNIIGYYEKIMGTAFSPVVSAGLATVNMAGLALFFLAGPVFFHALFSKKASFPEKVSYFVFNAAAIGLAFLSLVTGNAFFRVYLVQPALFCVIAYLAYFGFVRFKTLGHPLLRKALVVALLVTAGFLPLFVFDFIRTDLFFALPLYYFVANIFAIIFSFRYLGEPAYSLQNRATEYFRKKFSISPRETEIIDGLLAGLSNQAIGEALFISGKTVENHLYSIYQKTGVKNRIQLYTLLQNGGNPSRSIPG